MTSPLLQTVLGVSAPYANFLRPMPPVGPGVCATCRRGIDASYDRPQSFDNRCFNCHSHPARPHAVLDAAAFIALAPAEEQLATELRRYKDSSSDATRQRFELGLAAVLWRWLAYHEACLAVAAGVAEFDVITTVPSSSSGRDGAHPLVQVVSGRVVGSATRYRDLLIPSGVTVGQRDFSSRRFQAADEVRGRRVLVVDDTWASGAKMYGAAAALKSAGAAAVGSIAIGRWYHPGENRNAAAEQARRSLAWTWDTCMIHV